ncbi:uncharacterized protein LOC110925320 [Helianthus annuus]|uniref:uncharacterized protein LOC110925320 n=1 Tax=Helianthus annuus TaxID=4232 RepID=UPI000B8FE318|nr:uncharacterized protein LOC110925320 [Helianthus annuus]
MYTRGDQGHPTIILEAVASQDLWIWHAFFGIPGSNNDINVLQNSKVFDDVIKGVGPDTSFTVSGVEYRRGYYLADGIYPQYSTIVKTVRHPADEKERNLPSFKKWLEKILNGVLGFSNKDDEGHAICEYDENAVEENNVPVSGEQQDLNRFSLHNDFTHVNLQLDLIDHIWSLGENNA